MPDTTCPAHRGRRRSRPRRGATLVLVAVTMTVLMAFAGLGLDIARMYTYVAQLKLAADAAALATAQGKKKGLSETAAKNNALALLGSNRVNGRDSVLMGTSDIVPGRWNYNTRTFSTVAGGWTDTAMNAVRVTARYNANWTLLRLYGGATRTLSQQSVAVLGSQGNSECIKPFAVPYTAILQRLGRPTPYNQAYNLTAADIQTLASNTNQVNLADLRNNDPNTVPPGSFGLLGFEGTTPNEIAEAIVECEYEGPPVVAGTILPAAPGNKWNARVMQDALETMCGGNPTCPSQPQILVPIYDSYSGNGQNAGYRIKYLGAFKLVSYSISGNNATMRAILTAVTATESAGFTPAPGPVMMTVLVQ